MLVEEFLDRHPEIARSHDGDRLLAIAWFMLIHEGKERFTFLEAMDRLRSVGINAAQIPLVGIRYCDPNNQKLMNLVENNQHSYRLTRQTKIELDAKYADCLVPKFTIAVADALGALPGTFPILANCPYWEETIVCYRNKALRAAVIMSWNLIYNRLCEYILADPGRTTAFNQRSARPVSIRDDFTEFRESDVLTWARNAGIVIPNVYTILAEKLKRRNMFAHASGITPIPQDVDGFVIDLIQNVLPRIM
jgi:hypothetical protein